MKIAVVGVGYVGLVAAACLADGGNHVICVDHDEKKIKGLQKGIVPIYEPGLKELVERGLQLKHLVFTTDLKKTVDQSQVILLGVGTPSSADGSADISAVLSVAGEIAQAMTDYRIIVVKSTVPIGTCQKVTNLMKRKTKYPFDYVSNPEFLKEGSAVEDFLKPDRVIVGTDKASVQEVMQQLYSPFMRKNSRILFMDTLSAEMTKYAANIMLATRITLMNEFSLLCEQCGADIEKVRKGLGSDSRIGSSFLFPGVGYGGSCFPKDVQALIHIGGQFNCPMRITHAVQQTNLQQQDHFAQRVIDYFKDQNKPATLAVWGLAFKARTDDIRQSPALHCIEQFLQAGFEIRAYDPEAMTVAQNQLGDRIEFVPSIDQVLDQADGLVIFTDWQEFRSPDFEQIARKLNRPVIFDGRNLYDPDFVKKYGIEYHSIGRKTV